MGGDPAADPAFVALFRDEYPGLVRLAYLMVGDRAMAEDVVQEAFARLFARWRQVSRYERPGAWVRRVAIRIAGRVRRRREVPMEVEVESAGPPPGDPELLAAVGALPTAQRAAVILHYFEDRPVAEVAEILGCATSTARVHLHRARDRLRRVLREANDVVG